jgi:hypothetical protein
MPVSFLCLDSKYWIIIPEFIHDRKMEDTSSCNLETQWRWNGSFL